MPRNGIQTVNNKNYLFMLKFLLPALLCLALWDCRCSRQQIVINKVLIEVPEGIDALSSTESQDELRRIIWESIAENPNFHFNIKAQKGAILRLSYIAEGRSNESALLRALLSQKHWGEVSDQSAFATVNLSESVDIKNVKPAIKEVLQNLSKLALKGVVDKSQLHNLLEESRTGKKVSSAELINAIALLGKERDKDSVSYLVPVLSAADDLSVAEACLLALGEIADESAMEAIIDFAERKPPYIRRQAIIAAQKVASPLAMHWLLVMAYGHEDEVVRKEALAAFLDVEKKRAQDESL
jgi:HEAT repeats